MTPAATFPMQHLCTHVCFMSTWGRLWVPPLCCDWLTREWRGLSLREALEMTVELN